MHAYFVTKKEKIALISLIWESLYKWNLKQLGRYFNILLSKYPSVYLSINPSIRINPSIHVHPSFIHIHTFIHVHLFVLIHPSMFMFIHQSIHLSIYVHPSIHSCSSIHPCSCSCSSIYPSIYPPIYPFVFIHPSIHSDRLSCLGLWDVGAYPSVSSR